MNVLILESNARNSHGTSHVVTADASGMAFSLTTTINLFFGSRLMDPETGIILNDEMNGKAHLHHHNPTSDLNRLLDP